MSHKYEINKRWRKKHPSTWQKGKSRYYKKSEEKAHNKRQRWTVYDINLIISKNGKTDTEIAGLIGRSVGAIQVMRNRLKLSPHHQPSQQTSNQPTHTVAGLLAHRHLEKGKYEKVMEN